MEDNLHDTIEAAFDAAPAEESTVTTEVQAGPEVREPKSEGESRARDEHGRFAKAGEAPKADEKPAVDPAAAIAPAPLPQQSTRKAPSSWKAEAQAAWAKLEAGEVLSIEEQRLLVSEAERREGDFHKGIEGWKTHAEQGKAYEKVLAPYQQTLAQLNVDGPTAVAELLKVRHILTTAPESVKAAALIQVAQQFGIDLSKQFSPDVARYEQELYQTKEQLRQIQQQAQEQSSMSLNSEIDKFASAPGHEHFQAVRVHMASLLESGAAKDMDEAYDMAVYANPETRAALLQQQAREKEETNRAQRASAAAVSVKGSSPASGAPSATRGSLRGDIEAAFENHS